MDIQTKLNLRRMMGPFAVEHVDMLLQRVAVLQGATLCTRKHQLLFTIKVSTHVLL